MQASTRTSFALVLTLALASCGQDSDHIIRDGREYVLLDSHAAMHAAKRVVADLPSQEEVRSRFAETGTMCHALDRLGFPHEAGVDLSGVGMIVPIGPPREDGGRAAPCQGFWIWAYEPPVEPGVVASVDINSDLYVLVDWAIESVGSYVDGEPVGEWVFWHRNGELRARGDLEAGVMTGAWRFWTASGAPDAALSGTYEAGARTGD